MGCLSLNFTKNKLSQHNDFPFQMNYTSLQFDKPIVTQESFWYFFFFVTALVYLSVMEMFFNVDLHIVF